MNCLISCEASERIDCLSLLSTSPVLGFGLESHRFQGFPENFSRGGFPARSPCNCCWCSTAPLRMRMTSAVKASPVRVLFCVYLFLFAHTESQKLPLSLCCARIPAVTVQEPVAPRKYEDSISPMSPRWKFPFLMNANI